jgi:hypothetical protein
MQVGEISKRSSEKWRKLTPDEKRIWEDKAETDKRRYKLEKERYTGPWQVPWKRAKKNPNAPKRPMSAFLYFSQEKRSIIKAQNPGLKNTEISRVLGQMWKSAPQEERSPHIEHEKGEREKYKVQMAAWREKEEERKAQIREKNEEEIQNIASRPKVLYDERTEPIPFSIPSNQIPVANDEHYGQYHNGAYPGYYPPPNYAGYGGDGSHAHYAPPHYQNWNHNHPEDERQGYYNDDYKPIPYQQDQEQTHPDKRYMHEADPSHPYPLLETSAPQHYSYDHSTRQMAAPTISAPSFEAGEDDFGMQAPF